MRPRNSAVHCCSWWIEFDEVFTALGPAERDEFLDTVVGAAATGRVVLTLQPHTYARCVEHPGLARLVGANTLLAPAMTPDEVRVAVRRPAALAGLEFEPGLADRIVADALAAPGDLTGLSTALHATWVRRTGRTLTLAGYAAAGGVQRAVEVYAEDVYGALTPAEREPARTILLRLCADGRSAADLAGCLTDAGPGGSAVLERLTERGLLRLTDSDRVELVHPVLAQRWPRLRGWLDQTAAEDDLARHLRQAAAGWAGAGRSAADLYRGARLVTALDWAAGHPTAVGPVEREFLHAGERLALATENRRRRRIVLLWKWLAAALAVAILAVAVATFAVVGQLRADAAARRAEAARVAAAATAEPDLRLALLLAVAAGQLDPGVAGSVRTVLTRAPDLIATAGRGGRPSPSAPTGRSVAAGDRDGTVRLYGASLDAAAELDGGPAPVNGLTFTADGRRLIAWGGESDPARSGIVVWDVGSRQPVGPRFGDAALGAGGGLAVDGVTLIVARAGAGAVPWNIEARTPSTAYQLPTGPVERLAAVRRRPGGRARRRGRRDRGRGGRPARSRRSPGSVPSP